MKPHLPVFLLLGLLAAAPATASVMNQDAGIVTYTDFGQNMGRYQAGEVNALLSYIRLQEGGVRITYTGTEDSNLMRFGMIDFGSTRDRGNAAAVGYTGIISVDHIETQPTTFTARVLGAGEAISYKSIEIHNTDFFHRAGETSNRADVRYTRLSKVITDVAPTVAYNGSAEDLLGRMTYRTGAGVQKVADAQGKETTLCGDLQYLTGGAMYLASTWSGKALSWAEEAKDQVFTVVESWGEDGIAPYNPLPYFGTLGDSGSPVWFYNNETGRYEYIVSLEAVGTVDDVEGNEYPANFCCGDCAWVNTLQDSFNKTAPIQSGVTELHIGAAVHTGEAYQATNGTTITPYSSQITDADGNVLASFTALHQGESTWKALNDVMDKATWYTYGDSYLNQTVETLYPTENLVFSPQNGAEGDIRLVLDADLDTGIGYVQFCAGDSGTTYTLTSAKGGSYQLDTAGWVIDKGATLLLQLSNTTDTAKEWRRVGEGSLHICGAGDNYIALNLGGAGVTYLEQTDGYAAYNVLVNTGARVVLQNVEQIRRDLTFGNGGGELDLNGNDKVWNNAGGAGFTIRALTEDAVISNRKAGSTSTLTYSTSGGQSFCGSFQDSADSALQVIYNAGEASSLKLTGVYTSLQNEESGLTVRSGKVSLEGTLTVHAQGSEDGKSAARLINENDWHYADARMDVTVEKGAVFELGGHARLSGDVRVEEGGVFLMRQGVNHQEEYVEGGIRTEDTDLYQAFFGLKGDVELAQGAAMRVEFSESADSTLHYAGDITGAGDLTLDTKNGAIELSGRTAVDGRTEVVSGRTLISGTRESESSTAELVVQQGAELSVGKPGESSLAITAAEGAEAASISGAGELGTQKGDIVIAGAGEAPMVISGATLELSESGTLRIAHAVLTIDSCLTGGSVVADGLVIQLTAASLFPELQTDFCTDRNNLMPASSTLQLVCTSVADTQLSGDVTLDISGIDIEGYKNLSVLFQGVDIAEGTKITAHYGEASADSSYTYNAGDASLAVFSTRSLPEPATATLSLMALSLLAARRRRVIEQIKR